MVWGLLSVAGGIESAAAMALGGKADELDAVPLDRPAPVSTDRSQPLPCAEPHPALDGSAVTLSARGELSGAEMKLM